VSDTASRDTSTDRSGPALKELFAESYDVWTVAAVEIVPDEVEAIQSQVKKWTDEEMLNLVVTTGGTGFAIRDVTPEVASLPLTALNVVGLDSTSGKDGFWNCPCNACYIVSNYPVCRNGETRRRCASIYVDYCRTRISKSGKGKCTSGPEIVAPCM